jgi:hypothetical protein
MIGLYVQKIRNASIYKLCMLIFKIKMYCLFISCDDFLSDLKQSRLEEWTESIRRGGKIVELLHLEAFKFHILFGLFGFGCGGSSSFCSKLFTEFSLFLDGELLLGFATS